VGGVRAPEYTASKNFTPFMWSSAQTDNFPQQKMPLIAARRTPRETRMPNLSHHSHPGQAQTDVSYNRGTLNRLVRSLAIAGVVLLGAAAHAADPQSPQARYQADRAACLKNDPNQDREACLKEAGAALQQSQKSGSVEGSGPHSAQDIARNRTLRCDALPPSDKEDCLRRMQGEGEVEGSVKGGGVLRTLERPIHLPAAQ
jgi:hypothetical protein